MLQLRLPLHTPSLYSMWLTVVICSMRRSEVKVQPATQSMRLKSHSMECRVSSSSFSWQLRMMLVWGSLPSTMRQCRSVSDCPALCMCRECRSCLSPVSTHVCDSVCTWILLYTLFVKLIKLMARIITVYWFLLFSFVAVDASNTDSTLSLVSLEFGAENDIQIVLQFKVQLAGSNALITWDCVIIVITSMFYMNTLQEFCFQLL